MTTHRNTNRRATTLALLLAPILATLSASPAHAQQDRPAQPARPTRPDTTYRESRYPGRTIYVNTNTFGRLPNAVLGVTPRVGESAADTLGLLIDDVGADTPAAKAGITSGSRIVSIDGIDLRLDARDVGDDVAESLPERRLRRQLGRKEAGDTVTLVVLNNGRRETKSVVLAESAMARNMRTMREGRRVLGVSFSQRGSMRDTAGLLITSITSGGAADKAGLNEGDRLISIDGIDLRVPPADADTPEGVEARVSRMRRQLDAVKDSQPVRLEVLSEGRRRTVSVMPTRERGWSFNTAGMANLAEEVRVNVGNVLNDPDVRRDLQRARTDVARGMVSMERDISRANAQVARDIARSRLAEARTMQPYGWSDSDRDDRAPRGRISGRTDGATLQLGGLSLAAVDKDFAQQLGSGSAEGALVIRTRGDWAPLKAGDVILAVETRRIRNGNELDVQFDRSRDQRVEIIRGGRMQIIIVPAAR
jgi:PDZ domain